jgi:glycerate kinase
MPEPLRILIAPDKFKGSLAAREVADALAAGFASQPGIITESCPVADGGEGFATALATHTEWVDGIHDPLGRPVRARCGWIDAATAVIEMSEASGLHRLAPDERDPWRATTRGTGQLIAHAVTAGASRILIGLGGSATNDAGAGAAAALGWQFLTSDGEPIDPAPSNFLAIERIEPPDDDLPARIIAACDVRNPLLGPDGAAHTYARQKGAGDRIIGFLETAVSHLADLVAEQTGRDPRGMPGAGAAGGLGYGLAAFCGAELRPGFPLVAEALRLEEKIAACDLVITGEGRLDAQTLSGKAPAEVASLARKHGKRVALVCGECDPAGAARGHFDIVIALRDLEPDAGLSMRNAASLLAAAARRLAQWARANS